MNAKWPYLLIGFLIILLGLFSFFRTFLGDPGIPDEIY